MEFSVRQATINDAQSLDNLQVSYFDKNTRENFNFVLGDNNYVFFVAEFESKIVGYVGASISYESSDLLTICVDKSYRSRGVAQTLILALIDFLKARDVQYILLEVNENNVGAIKLYEKMGFINIHQRKNYYGNETAFIMKKEL